MQLVYPEDAPLHGHNMDSGALSSSLIRLTGSQQRWCVTTRWLSLYIRCL